MNQYFLFRNYCYVPRKNILLVLNDQTLSNLRLVFHIPLYLYNLINPNLNLQFYLKICYVALLADIVVLVLILNKSDDMHLNS